MKTAINIINTKKQTANFLIENVTVSLDVYPRLHIDTFDLSLISGVLRHGSMGFSLKNFPIKIIVKKAKRDKIITKSNIDVGALDAKIDLNKLREYIRKDEFYEVEIENKNEVREHTGLGTSTQILGGIYLCCAKLSGIDLNIQDLFKLGL